MIPSPNRTLTSNYIGAANISLPDIVGNFPKSMGKVRRVEMTARGVFPGISTRPSPRPNFVQTPPISQPTWRTSM